MASLFQRPTSKGPMSDTGNGGGTLWNSAFLWSWGTYGLGANTLLGLAVHKRCTKLTFFLHSQWEGGNPPPMRTKGCKRGQKNAKRVQKNAESQGMEWMSIKAEFWNELEEVYFYRKKNCGIHNQLVHINFGTKRQGPAKKILLSARKKYKNVVLQEVVWKRWSPGEGQGCEARKRIQRAQPTLVQTLVWRGNNGSLKNS